MIGSQGAAGALLALDLLQRPFILVVSALHAIRYPELVASYDREPDSPAFRTRLGRYYGQLANSSLVTAALILCLLAPAAAWLVKLSNPTPIAIGYLSAKLIDAGVPEAAVGAMLKQAAAFAEEQP